MRKAIAHGTFKCVECGIALDAKAPRYTPTAAELDHILPVVDRPDLEFTPSNLAWRCHPCNRRKGRNPDPLIYMPTTRHW
ncbi:HNH endonuclease [Nocardioides ochotonae]